MGDVNHKKTKNKSYSAVAVLSLIIIVAAGFIFLNSGNKQADNEEYKLKPVSIRIVL
jgi:hypothetical protein